MSQKLFDPLAQTIEFVWKSSSPADPGGELSPHAVVRMKKPTASIKFNNGNVLEEDLIFWLISLLPPDCAP